MSHAPISEHYDDTQYLVTHQVTAGENGMRLDAFLKERYGRQSREHIQQSIDAGVIRVERNLGAHLTLGKLKASMQLMQSDLVYVKTIRKQEPEVNFNYKIIYEDDVLLIVDKPPQLPVHPAGIFFFNTLLTHLKTAGFTRPLRSEHEYFLVHRIDKETSGVLVLTKTAESCAALTEQFAERTTEKTYLAITRGTPPEKYFTVDAPIQRDPQSRIKLKMSVMPENEGGLSAQTDFEVLETIGKYALLQCFPKTGRQHQIRVHLNHAGFPLLGDKLYGQTEEFSLLFYERERLTPEAEAKLIHPRHALHAHCIKFRHPTSQQWVTFKSELADDLKEFLNMQRNRQ